MAPFPTGTTPTPAPAGPWLSGHFRPPAPAPLHPRTTTIYDQRPQNLDRHAAYVVTAFITSG